MRETSRHNKALTSFNVPVCNLEITQLRSLVLHTHRPPCVESRVTIQALLEIPPQPSMIPARTFAFAIFGALAEAERLLLLRNLLAVCDTAKMRRIENCV